MAELIGYRNTCVVQHNPRTGCIPAGIEWMLRFKGVKGVDFSDFQEQFDLQGKGGNNFQSVSSSVSFAYPHIKFQFREFITGKEKLAFVEALLAQGKPCLMSIALKPEGGWHIVPVVEINSKTVSILLMDDADTKKQVRCCQRDYLEYIHDNWPGGKDILAFE